MKYVAFLLFACLASLPAFAQIDVTGATGLIGDGTTAVTAIAGGLLALAATAYAFKWVLAQLV